MDELLTRFFPDVYWDEIWQGTVDTLWMIAGSMPFTVLIGLPLGIVLFLTGPRQLLAQPALYGVLSFVVNVLRSSRAWLKRRCAKWSGVSSKPRRPWVRASGKSFSGRCCQRPCLALSRRSR